MCVTVDTLCHFERIARYDLFLFFQLARVRAFVLCTMIFVKRLTFVKDNSTKQKYAFSYDDDSKIVISDSYPLGSNLQRFTLLFRRFARKKKARYVNLLVSFVGPRRS